MKHNYSILPLILIGMLLFSIKNPLNAMALEPLPDDEDTTKTKVIIRSFTFDTDHSKDTNCFVFEIKDGDTDDQLLKILNGKTIVNTIKDTSLVDSLINGLDDNNGKQIITKYFNHSGNEPYNLSFNFIIDSLCNVDSAFKTIESEFIKNIEIKSANEGNFIMLNDDGEFVTIEKDGEMVFINKQKYINGIDSDIELVKSNDGKNVIFIHTKITLDEIDQDDVENLKSNGISTTNNVPEFDYLKFYPKSAENGIQLSFKLSEPNNVAVKVVDMLGKRGFLRKNEKFPRRI